MQKKMTGHENTAFYFRGHGWAVRCRRANQEGTPSSGRCTCACQETVIMKRQIGKVNNGKVACNVVQCTVTLEWPYLGHRNLSLLTGGFFGQPRC